MKLIKKSITVWRVAVYEVRLVLFSTKFLILSLLAWMFMDFFVMEIRTFALDYHLKMIPAEIPFYFSDSIYANITLFLLILLFSDFPLNNSGQMQIRQRAGRVCYEWGQLLSVFLLAGIYVAEQLLLSVVVCLPCMEWKGWGKVWGTVAANKLQDLGYGNYVNVSQEVISNYQPQQAIFLSSVIFLLTGICYGLLVYMLNGISRGKLGTILLSVWSLSWVFITNTDKEWTRQLIRISPQGWNDLSRRRPEEVTGVILCAAVVVLALLALNRILAKWNSIK